MPDELIKRTKSMLGELHGLEGADRTYIFSNFFKKVSVHLPTLFGVVVSYPHGPDFSENKIAGFKAIMNKYSDIATGYVRIGDQVYQPNEQHEYKIFSGRDSREIIKALVGRAVKIGKFDLSMLDPAWLEHGPGGFKPEAPTPVGSMPRDDSETMDEAAAGETKYVVYDKHTSKIVSKPTSLTSARRMVDRKDNEYGGYRYSHRPA